MIGMKFSDSQFVFREPVSPVRLKIAVGGDFCPGEAGAALVRDGRAAQVFAPLAPFLDDADWRLIHRGTAYNILEVNHLGDMRDFMRLKCRVVTGEANR